jgi:hypothetical protein
MLEEKKVLPFGQVKWSFWSGSQMFGMFPRTQFMVAICTNTDQMMAAT